MPLDERWERLDPILDELLDLPPEDRPARLSKLTEGDDALRARLVEILAEDERTDGILDAPFDAIVAEVLEAEDPGETAASRYTQIGAYRVLRELGRGGMGEVLLAERADGEFEQQVALKIVRCGLDQEEIVERFRRERRILARLRHPNIAALYDGGATDDGMPYFAMEYVEGERITDWCDANRLGITERVKLFESVCRAVHYAHRNLVIHRDIKPSNVFVTRDGTVKLLDFGIGKILDDDGADETNATRGFMTPGFAAPEQIRGEATSTSTDVFALGLLLYVLLTGHHAHGDTSGVAALAKAVLEDDTPQPSTRAGLAGGKLSAVEIADRRSALPAGLRRELQGDLDNIIGKALRKNPDNRYASVEDLRADLERHRNLLPIEARPATARYRIRKFVRRNRLGVVAASAIVVAVASGVAGVVWQAGVAGRERDRAEAALAEEQQRAAELKQVADFQAEQMREIDAQTMGDRLRQLVLDSTPEDRRSAIEESLSEINFTTIALTALGEDVFQRTIEAIDAQFSEQPVLQAQLLQTVAIALQDLGLFDLAADPQRRALEIRRTELGDEHPDTLTSISNMGFQCNHEGRFEQAETFYRAALDGRRRVLGDDDPDTLISCGNLASLLIDLERMEEAELYSREALDGSRRVLGNEHADTLAWCSNMGQLLRSLGRLEEAEAFYREALVGSRRALGDEAPQTQTVLNNLGYILKAQGKLAEAEVCYRESLATRRATLGDDHPGTIIAISNMGGLLRDLGRLEAANRLGIEAVERFRATRAEGHWHIGVGLRQHAETLVAMQLFVEAESEALEAHAILANALGADHARTGRAVEQLVQVYSSWNQQEPEAGHDVQCETWRQQMPCD